MKILSVNQIRELDAHTIANEPIPSIDLMERASKAFCNWFTKQFDSSYRVLIYCGTGNNGGDGLAIARLLNEANYDVKVVIIGDAENGSTDFLTNKDRLPPGLLNQDSNPSKSDIVIDTIFGSGLTRPAEGIFAEAIQAINQSASIKVAVDIPSGLFADRHTDSENIVKADYTISFQLPKLVFMLPEAHQYVGQWFAVDIGLSREFIAEADTPFQLVTKENIKANLKQTSKFDHKGSNGHTFLAVGSYGKMGAAILAARAALRAGTGLLTVQVPKSGNDLIQLAVPEAMTMMDVEDDTILAVQANDKWTAIGVGPGLGQSSETVNAIKQLLNNYEKPLVMDADALNIIAEHRELLELIPEHSILTPHPKEFKRLLGYDWDNDFERLEYQRKFSIDRQCIVVLKGAHTSITSSNGSVCFNSTGNPGMAKGGSGDVLTGVITSLIAQGYQSYTAAIVGVYLHGLAGDLAKEKYGEISMTSSDIVEMLPAAHLSIKSQ